MVDIDGEEQQLIASSGLYVIDLKCSTLHPNSLGHVSPLGIKTDW